MLRLPPPRLSRQLANLRASFLAQGLRPGWAALQSTEVAEQLRGRVLLAGLGSDLASGHLDDTVGELIRVRGHL